MEKASVYDISIVKSLLEALLDKAEDNHKLAVLLGMGVMLLDGIVDREGARELMSTIEESRSPLSEERMDKELARHREMTEEEMDAKLAAVFMLYKKAQEGIR